MAELWEAHREMSLNFLISGLVKCEWPYPADVVMDT
jgi:hypothetical protein